MFMNRYNAAAFAVLVSATMVAAQGVTTQSSVVGPSGDAVYSEQIVGANGVVYNCRPDPVSRQGVMVRLCQNASAGAAANGTLGGLGGAGAAAAAGLVLVALVVANKSSTSTTN